MTYPTPHAACLRAITMFEGGWQAQPTDDGNWVNAPEGRKLIGTMRGVTPYTYAKHIGVKPWTLTPERMQREITAEVAAEIGVVRFYEGFNIDELEWGPLAEIVLDFAWGSGGWAIKELQALIGATVDGALGPQTAKMHAAYIRRFGPETIVRAMTARRKAFYIRISEPPDKDFKYRAGWLRRADWYMPNNAEWWGQWTGWAPTGGGETSRPIAPPDPVTRARFYLGLADEALREAAS